MNKNGEVLVVSQHGTSWSLPKGVIEEGETDLEAAEREIWEESNIRQLELVKELGSYERYRISRDGGEDKSESKHITIFLFKTNETDLKSNDPHNPEARWVKKEDVAGLLTHPKDKEFFERILTEI